VEAICVWKVQGGNEMLGLPSTIQKTSRFMEAWCEMSGLTLGKPSRGLRWVIHIRLAKETDPGLLAMFLE